MMHMFMNDLLATFQSSPDQVKIVTDNARTGPGGIDIFCAPSVANAQSPETSKERRDRWRRMKKHTSDSCLAAPQRNIRETPCQMDHHESPSGRSPRSSIRPRDEVLPRSCRETTGPQRRSQSSQDSGEDHDPKRLIETMNAIMGLTGSSNISTDVALRMPMRFQSPDFGHRPKKRLSELDDSTHLKPRVEKLKNVLRNMEP